MDRLSFLRFPGRFILPVLMMCLAAVAQTQSAPAPTDPHERLARAERRVSDALGVWQKRLRLQDWNITTEMTRAKDLKPNTLGNIHWDLDKKSAVIHVMDPVDYRMPFDDMLDDMEFTVVHELIHLQLAPLLSSVPRNQASRRAEEHTVNNLATALLGK